MNNSEDNKRRFYEILQLMIDNDIHGIIHGSAVMGYLGIAMIKNVNIIVKDLSDYVRFGKIIISSMHKISISFELDGITFELSNDDGFGNNYFYVEKIPLTEENNIFLVEFEEWLKWKRKMDEEYDLKKIDLLLNSFEHGNAKDYLINYFN